MLKDQHALDKFKNEKLMAQIFNAKKNKAAKQGLQGKTINLTIERLDDVGRGVGYYQKKAIFVDYALPQEMVVVKVIEQTSKYIKAKLVNIIHASEHREDVTCPHFYKCGGCDLQHLTIQQQRIVKQEKVTRLFQREHIVNLPWYPPITSQPYEYRRKTRIGVQYDKNDKAIVGYRQPNTNHLVNIKTCPVLEEPANQIFTVLAQVIDALKAKKSVGHIECITLDQDSSNIKQLHLIIRQLSVLSDHDQSIWLNAATQYNWYVWVDDGKNTQPLNNISAVKTIEKPLFYSLEDNTKIYFSADDFIQVNHQVNKKMVAQAVQWLTLEKTDNVLDLFCGLGNFSLPIAKQVHQVYGVEGVQSMVDKAIENAKQNGCNNAHFYQMDLNNTWQFKHWPLQHFNKILLDPARAGAEGAMLQIVALQPEKVLYVSCEPKTLARDSKTLMSAGYRIEKISIIDMFSQTKHVETMVLFTL